MHIYCITYSPQTRGPSVHTALHVTWETITMGFFHPQYKYPIVWNCLLLTWHYTQLLARCKPLLSAYCMPREALEVSI